MIDTTDLNISRGKFDDENGMFSSTFPSSMSSLTGSQKAICLSSAKFGHI